MPRNYKIYLNDILDAIAAIEEFTASVSIEKFSTDRMRKDAVIKNLMIIGEAAKNVPENVQSKATEIEWEEIAGFRDVLIHQYFGTDLETVWDIIKNDLPKLKKSVQKLLQKSNSS